MNKSLVLIALGAFSGAAFAAPATSTAPSHTGAMSPTTTHPMAAKPAMKSAPMKSSANTKPAMMKTMNISAADRTYLRADAHGSVYDSASAKLAVQRAHSPAVHQYAVMLTQDHARLNTQLLSFARSRKMSLPVSLLTADKIKLEKLQGKSGAAFDKAYLTEAVKINADDVQKGTKEIASTKDAGVKKLVGGFVATERKHLASAKSLLAKTK